MQQDVEGDSEKILDSNGPGDPAGSFADYKKFRRTYRGIVVVLTPIVLCAVLVWWLFA
jgi:hypothetical protein